MIMIGKKIISNKVVPLSEVLAMLTERENAGELGFEQKGALEYSSKFSHLSVEKSNELISKLSDLPFVSDAMAVKLVDLLPKKEEEIQLIFAQEKRDLTKAQIKQLLETIAEF